MKDLWYIGNTSVRSPLRLREGILALKNAPYLQGNIRGKKQKLFLWEKIRRIVLEGNGVLHFAN